MTEEELQDKILELKYDKIAIQVMRPLEVLGFSCAALFDYKFVKDIYELGYVLHIDYFNLPSSKVDLCFLFISISSFACVRYVKEMLKEDGLDENQDYVIVNICW